MMARLAWALTIGLMACGGHGIDHRGGLHADQADRGGRYIDRGAYVADASRRSVHYGPRIRYLVIHYTALDDDRSLSVLSTGGVSVHYLVLRDPFLYDGTRQAKPFVYALVPEGERAWHAGESHWQRASDLNDSSVGIEIVNTGPLDAEKRTWEPFNDAQMDAVLRLARDIVTRYAISPTKVVGHADIAPQRKEDPGPLFPWEKFAEQGVGAWPDAADVERHLAGRDAKSPVDLRTLQSKLAAYGYDIATDGSLDDATRRVLSAFQMHFRPADYAGDADAETEAIADALIAKYAR
jgi:N-acetylmuramoyl-L-alanine amidase